MEEIPNPCPAQFEGGPGHRFLDLATGEISQGRGDPVIESRSRSAVPVHRPNRHWFPSGWHRAFPRYVVKI